MKIPHGLSKDIKKWHLYAINGYFSFAFVSFTEEENTENMTAKEIGIVIESYIASFNEKESERKAELTA